MAALRDALAPYAETFEIHSAESFSVLGQRYTSEKADVADRNDEPLNNAARKQLADLLYYSLHCRQPPNTYRVLASERDFVAQLSNANAGSGPWHIGWTVRAVDDHDQRLIVEQGDLRLWVDQTEFAPDAGVIESGATGRVSFPKEYRHLYPGHYVAHGDLHSGQRGEAVRFYWHLTMDGAVPLVAGISRAFNTAQVPFQLKVLSNPSSYWRTDAAILYVPVDAEAPGTPLVWDVYREIASLLRAPVSAYVLELAPGLGYADDPNDGSSFGQHRSNLLASALCHAAEGPARLEQIADWLRNAGYDPSHFYRGTAR